MELQPPETLTTESKLETMTQYLTSSHLDAEGGYPFDYDDTTFPGHLVIASVDDNGETSLRIYDKTELLEWFDRALALFKQTRAEYGDDAYEFFEALGDEAIR